MPPEIGALFTMMITLSPFFITIFLVLQSFAKNNLQGIVYLCGLILAEMFGYLMRPIFGNMGVRPDIALLETGQKYIQQSRACNLIEDPWFSMYSCPSFHALFHAFSITYIFANDFSQNTLTKNMGLFATFIFLYVCDFIFRVANGCVTWIHWLIGTFVGFILGLLWYLLISSTNQKLVYNSYVSDRKHCKLTKQNFGCQMKIYKQDGGTTTALTTEQINALTANQWKEAWSSMAV